MTTIAGSHKKDLSLSRGDGQTFGRKTPGSAGDLFDSTAVKCDALLQLPAERVHGSVFSWDGSNPRGSNSCYNTDKYEKEDAPEDRRDRRSDYLYYMVQAGGVDSSEENIPYKQQGMLAKCWIHRCQKILTTC